MNQQIAAKGGLTNNLWVQLAVLLTVVLVLVALAAMYIW